MMDQLSKAIHTVVSVLPALCNGHAGICFKEIGAVGNSKPISLVLRIAVPISHCLHIVCLRVYIRAILSHSSHHNGVRVLTRLGLGPRIFAILI